MTLRLSALLGLLAAAAACSTPTHLPTPVSPADVDDTASRGRPLRIPVLELRHHGAMGSAYYHVDANVPELILYEDGLMVYVDGEGDRARIRQVHLSADEVYAMLDDAATGLAPVPEHIEASTASDQPSVSITVFHDNRQTTAGVYGIHRDGTPSLSLGTKVAIPSSFVALYRELQDYRHPDAQPWQPDEIEVVLWNKDDLRDAAIAWPEVLPLPPVDAREPRPFSRPRGRPPYPRPIMYRVDGDRQDSIDAALARIGQTPLQWNGHKWLVQTRRVLPGGSWS